MLEKAEKSNAILRPHFKTHQSAEIAEWFRSNGVEKCTVSSVSMAHYFAENGWNDITIAFPYNPLEHEKINELASKINLTILLECQESLDHVKKHISSPLDYLLKIEVGSYRAGIDPRNEKLIASLVHQSDDRISYKGFLVHAGHTYGAKGTSNMSWIVEATKKMVLPLKAKFGGIISYGDTPSCSMMSSLPEYDELRPGNFVFYDWMQKNLGSCQQEDIAICLSVPVVASYPERSEIIVYGGAVHLSKDCIEEGNTNTFGKVVMLEENGWGNEIIGNLSRLTQEHGVIKLDKNHFNKVHIGDLLGIIPVHSCLAANLQPYYFSTKGKRIDKINRV